MSLKRLLLVVVLLAVTIAAVIFVLTGPRELLGFTEYGQPAASGDASDPGESAVGIVINEIMPSNSGAVLDESGGTSDWFELYNPTGEAVSLSGFSLTDDESQGAKYVFPNISLEPDSYLLIFASGRDVRNAGAPYLHTPFKLKGDETLLLTDAAGQRVDDARVPDMPSNVSVGRSASDINNWEEFQEPTPGFPNDANGRQAYLDSLNSTVEGLSINEIMASNQTTLMDEYGEYPDWVEIYNSTNGRIDLSGFGLTDRVDDLMRFKFPEGTGIEAGQYLVIFCSDRRDPLGGNSGLHAPFALSSYRETVILADATGKIIDEAEYQELGADVSYARNAENPGLWELSARPTPGYPNDDDGYDRFQEEYAEAQGPLYISEVMFGSADLLEGGEGYDWIELHNSSDETVDLSRYGLSDNTKNPVKWRFPEGVSIEPDGHLVVLCSGRNVVDLGEGDAKKKYYETNFGVSNAGEILTLANADGRLLDKVNISRLPYGVSYGRTGGEPFYYAEPTPLSANGSGQKGVTAQPVFGTSPGVYDAPIEVALSAEGADIFYTTDSTTPTRNSQPYSGPIQVSENTVIRAISMRDGFLTSRAATGVFLFTSDGVNHALPIANLVTDPDNLWDDDTGIYAYGDSFDPEEDFPRISGNYYRGKESEDEQTKWEREANFSIFGDDKRLAFTQDADIRIAGSFGRGNPQKGFNVIARGAYGASRFNYPFFSDRSFTQYKALTLRAGGQDQRMSKLRDELATGLLEGTDVNILRQAYKPYVLYLNGEYWGVYFLKEKRNRFFVEQHETGEVTGDIPMDLIKSASQIYYGSSEDWKDLMEYIKVNGASSREAFQHVADCVDLQSFMDYMICEIYSANSDTYNIQYYKLPGGKWKWIYYDFCWSFGNTENGPEHKTLSIRRLDSRPCSDLFNALLENREWRDAFINRFAELIRTVYDPARVNAKIDELEAVLAPEIEREREKFNAETFMGRPNAPESLASADVDKWRADHIEARVRNFANKRPAAIIKLIGAEFGMSSSELREVFGEYASSDE